MIQTNENLLIELDELEESIAFAEEINKKYDELKKSIKESMVKAGIAIGTDQIKWTTPKGTKITCSIGHCAEFEKQIVKEFDLEKLKEKYPNVYEDCLVDKEKSIMVKNASNNTLRITLAKGE